MYKAYKFRLYPNDNQIELINKTFGCSRLVYNHYLSLNKEQGYNSPYTNINDYVNNYKYEKSFLQGIDSVVIRKTIFHLDDNLKKSYNNNFGYPKYKSKYDKNSYMTSAIYRKYKDRNYCNIEVDLNKRVIKLPKLKEVKIRGYRNLNKIKGRIINATISRERNNKYYVSVMVKIPNVNKKKAKEVVGLDIGVKKLIALSDGITYENNKYIEKYEKRIKRLQRELSRKEKGSNNNYKSKYKGKYFYQIDTYYPPSQMCSICGNISKKYKKLSERTYRCNKCNNTLDRDFNASINIMFEGIKLYMKEVFS